MIKVGHAGIANSDGALTTPAHYFLRFREIVLIMRALGCAVRNNESRLTGSPCATGTLGVICRGWRNVPEINGIESGDVHARFHRGGTEEGQEETS